MNLLANAIDVFDEAAQQSSFAELEAAFAYRYCRDLVSNQLNA